MSLLSNRPLFSPRLVLVALAAGLLANACTDASLREIPPDPPKKADNLLRIKGDFCTEPSARVTFPVKVLYIIDQSASLQCTDAKNRRFDALKSSLKTLRSQPNVEFGFVGFSSWVRSSLSGDKGFTRQLGDVQQFLDPSKGLGPATDYQGSMATAIQILEQDLRELKPAERARTRYMINFVSDGVPEPRCNQGCEDDGSACSDGEDNDGDGRVDGEDSDCDNIDDNSLHPDNLYGVCNTTQEIPEDKYVDMDGVCPAYNQNQQIMKRVQDLQSLEETFNVGGITLNSVLLFSPQSQVAEVCPDAASQFGYEREQAATLLKAMAEEGDGTFRDVNLEEGDSDFLDFRVSSLKAEQTMTTMYARNRHSAATDEGPVPDSDTDGLSDRAEREANLDPLGVDSDGDRYRDLFETRLSDRGFDPNDDSVPAIPCQSRRDGDGDGLLDCEEEIVGTRTTESDTDGDGLSDWLEVLAQTDPTEEDAHADTDFDSVSNLEEIRGGSDPLAADEETWRSSRVTYGVEDRGLVSFGEDGDVERHCYDFDVQRIKLVTTPIPRKRGLNRVLLQTSERPAKVAGVPGRQRVACIEAFYNEGGVKQPADGVVDLSAESIDRERRSLKRRLEAVATCPVLAERGSVNRGAIQKVVEQCMPPKIEVDRRLYTRQALFEMLQRHVGSNLSVRLPERPFEFFVSVPSFNPERDCYRPWELDRLKSFLRRVETACGACVEDEADAGVDTDP